MLVLRLRSRPLQVLSSVSSCVDGFHALVLPHPSARRRRERAELVALRLRASICVASCGGAAAADADRRQASRGLLVAH